MLRKESVYTCPCKELSTYSFSLLFLLHPPSLSISCSFSLLLPLSPPPLSLPSGIAPLFLAARGGFLELVKALTKKGADVNSLGASQGISALHWAAHKEHEDVALFLIENGGDISLLDKEGRTPLSMASPELVTKMIGKEGRRRRRREDLFLCSYYRCYTHTYTHTHTHTHTHS